MATYTPPVGSPLGPGPHTLIVSATDKAGNPGTATREFFVDPLAGDEVPPVLVSTTPETTETVVLPKVAEKRPVVSITVSDSQSKLDPGSISAQLTSAAVDVTPEYTAIDIKSCTITFVYTEDLVDGEHSASLSIADEAGNAATFNWSFEVDTTGPTAPTLVVPECVADESLTVTGETEPGARVKLILNGILYQEISADMASGAYSFVDVPLATGLNTLQVIPTDLLVNLGEPSEKKTVIYDTVPPVISVSSPQPNQIVSKLEVPISASITDNCGVDTDTIELTVNDVPVANYNFNENTGKLSFMTPTLPDNSIIPVTIAAKDLSGLDSSYTFNFETRVGIADTNPPVIDNVSIAGIPVFMGDEVTVANNQPEIRASVIDADSEIATVSINGAGQYDETTGVIIYQPPAPQADDTYGVTIIATDTASPPNTASFLFTYTVKTSIPEPTVELDPDVERTKAESIGVVVSGVEKGVQAVWGVNGVPVFSHKFTGETSYYRSVLLAEGENEIIVEVSDAFGNTNQSDTPVVVVKDTVPPSVNLENPVNADIIAGGTVNIDLAVSDPSGVDDVTLDVEDPNSILLTPTEISQTSYTIDANTDGIYRLTVTATDGVGNQTQPKAFSFTADSTPPEVRIDSPTASEASALPYSIPELTGYVDPNDVDLTSSIEVTIDGEVVVHAYNAGSGQVTVTPQEFADGTTHTLIITASDSVGNDDSADREFTIDLSVEDRTDPVLASFFPIPDSTISGTSLSLLQFLASDSGGINSDLVMITINGKTFKISALNTQSNRGHFMIFLDRSLMVLDRQQLDGGGGFQFDPLELGALERSFGAGTNTISVQVSDKAGNTSTSSWSFNVVTEPPKVPVLDEIPNITSEKNITLTGTVAEVSPSNPVKVSMLVNGTVVRTVKVAENGKFTAESLMLVAGNNQIAAKATDQAGNQSKISTPVEVVRDIEPPQISLDDLPAITGESILTVSGSITDNTEISSISLIVNKERSDLGIAVPFSQEIELVDGDNTIQIEATDSADNVGTSVTVTVSLDNVAPDTAPADLKAQLNVAGNAAKLVWTSDEGAASYNVYRSSAPIADATDLSPVLSNVSETSTTDYGLPVGKTVYYAVTSVDAAGNEDTSIISNSPNITLITSSGGTASLTDGTKARFGKMALSSNPNVSAVVAIEKLDDSAVEDRVSTQRNAVAGSTREFTATSQIGEAIETLNNPITITIPYAKQALLLPDLAESPQIRFLEDEKWTEIETTVKLENNLATAKVSKLGIYRLVEIELRPWDANGDDTVNIFDLVLVGKDFGKSGEGITGDINDDNVVNIFDLVLVGSHFGESYGSASAAPSLSAAIPSLPVKMVAEQFDSRLEVILEISNQQLPGPTPALPTRKGVPTREEIISNLSGFQFELHFDPTRLSLLNVTEGNALKANGTRTYWLEPEVTSGSVKAASVALAGQSRVATKSVVLAKASFKLKDDPTSETFVSTALKTIKVNDIKLSDNDGKLIPVKLDNAVKLLSDKVELRNALLPNYPNPFNPETWVPYSVAQDSSVTVKIYNLLGQTVRKLDVGFVKAGEQISKDKAVYWDGRNERGEYVASGVYFYQIDILNNSGKKFTATRKLVILK